MDLLCLLAFASLTSPLVLSMWADKNGAIRSTQEYAPLQPSKILLESTTWQFSNYSPPSSPVQKYYIGIIRVPMWPITGSDHSGSIKRADNALIWAFIGEYGPQRGESEKRKDYYLKKTVAYTAAKTSTKGFKAPRAKEKVLLLLLKI